MNEVFYRKVGRRYQPVSQWDEHLLNALPGGSYLLTVAPGRQSLCKTITPEAAPLLCVLEHCRDEVISAILDASSGRLVANSPMTAIEKKAWNSFKQIAGPDSVLLLQYPSAAEIYDRLRDKLLELTTTPRQTDGDKHHD